MPMTIPQLICLNVSRVVPSKSKGNNTKFLDIWDVSSNPEILELVYQYIPLNPVPKRQVGCKPKPLQSTIAPNSPKRTTSCRGKSGGEFTRVMTLVWTAKYRSKWSTDSMCFFWGVFHRLFHRRIYPLENSHGTPRMRFGWRFCSTKNQQKSEDLQAMFLSLVGMFCFSIFFCDFS